MSLFPSKNRRGAKLTVDQVLDIRARYEAGETQASLSRLYSVSLVQIGRIVRRECWQGLEPAASVEELAAGAGRLQILAAQIEAERQRQPEVMLRELETPLVELPKPEVSESLKEKMKGYGIGED